MKKFFAIACMMLMSTALFAQDINMAAGVNLGYGFGKESYNPVQFGVKLQCEFIENVRGEASANMYTKKDGAGLWDANLNFHYLFPVAEKVRVYPLAGVALVGTHGLDKNESAIGFNVGAGVDYKLTDNLTLNAEFKYQKASKEKEESFTFMGVTYTQKYKVIDASWEVLSIGLTYSF